jgi:hypothetical protein
MNKIIIAKIIVSCVLLTGIICFFSVVSCNVSTSQLMILAGDYTTPKLDFWEMNDANTLNLYFTREVTFPALSVLELPSDGGDAQETQIVAELVSLNSTVTSDTETICLPLQFSENTVVGIDYLLVGTAKDEYDNTLDFTLSFAGYNSTIPAMVLSEVRTEYSKTTSSTRVEFVEFVVLSDGNTAGMEFISTYDGEDEKYTFPYIKVLAGEYIVLHMRTLDEDAITETDDDLLASNAKDSSAARDLWIDNTDARIGADDVLLLKDRENGTILDAVLYSRSGKDDWSKDEMSIAAKEAYSEGIWIEGYMPENATCSDTITLTRTLSRQNIDDCIEKQSLGDEQPYSVLASDWIIVNTSCCTPGEVNSTEEYVE